MDSKAQAWYMDFIIGLMLFTVTVAVYFGYIHNFQKHGKSELDTMLSDAKAISSSLTLGGYPNNWDNSTVVRIGIADEQEVNATKLKFFKQLNYSKTKNRFATIYDYFMFFQNKRGEVINIHGVCGVGHPLINTSFNIKSAYYYQDSSDSFLKNFMVETFNADIYFKDQSGDIYGLYGLISNLSKYDLVMLEHPLINGGDYNEYYKELNNYTADGGIIITSGELVTTGSGADINGVVFDKIAGQSEPKRTAIVNSSDKYLALKVGEPITFYQYYFVNNFTSLPIEPDSGNDDYNPYPAANFKIIASYNKTPEDYAIAKWQYGNGTSYFFSDFDVTFFNGNFVNVVEEAIEGFIEGTCSPIDTANINIKKLLKIERYLYYNSEIIKMIIYLWS
ncbi:MAG: hypothetical protein AABX33_08975 [Nanoarchaeota archaeon]